MRRCPSEKLLFLLAAGELSAGESTRLAAHVQGCDCCKELLSSYEETLSTLRAGERYPETCPEAQPGARRGEIGSPSADEWNRLMTGVRDRVKPRTLARPSWAKAGAIAAVAGVAVFLALWQAGVLTNLRPHGAPGIALRDEASSRSETTGEGSAVDSEAGKPAGGTVAGEEGAAKVDAAREGSDLDLASLDTEIYELDELIEGVGGTEDSDFMLLYLTEEEEAKLIDELEAATNLQESDEGRR